MQKQEQKSSMRRSCCAANWLLKWDYYGSPVQFSYERDSQTYRSPAGACFSLLAMFITIVFCVQQAIVMLEYKGTTFTSSLLRDHLDNSFTYYGHEFPIAIAMYDIYQPDFITRSGVNFKVYLEQFNPTKALNSDILSSRESIETHSCSDEELSKFYDVPEINKLQYEAIKPQLHCFDLSKV